jgi:hypothetical protein
MGLKDPGAVLVRGSLQNVSIAYRPQGFVADLIFPTISGLARQTKVPKYTKGPWFKDSAQPRAPKTSAKVISYDVATQDLDPINYAIAGQVSDEEEQNAGVAGSLPMDLRVDTLEMLAGSLMISQEERVADVIKAAAWSGQAVGGVDAANSWGHGTSASDTFLDDMDTGRTAFHAAGAPPPNSLLLDFYAYQSVRKAPALLDKIYPTGFGKDDFVSPQSLANLAGVERIIVGTAVYDDSEPLQTGADTSFNAVDIWDSTGTTKKGLGFLFYSPAAAGLKQQSSGYIYKIGQPNGSYRLSTGWRDSATHSDFYDSQEECDIAAVSLDCGYLWYDTAKA